MNDRTSANNIDYHLDDRDDMKIIKLRGLPWNSTPSDILGFLKDVNVVDNEKGVHMSVSNRDGRPNGEAFVELESMDDVDKAMSYNKNLLGQRYIESKSEQHSKKEKAVHYGLDPFYAHFHSLFVSLVFNAKPEEFDMCLKRQNVMQQDTFIKMRGLPFSCKLDDIENFFSGNLDYLESSLLELHLCMTAV